MNSLYINVNVIYFPGQSDWCNNMQGWFIGTSMSELHTSGTALQDASVCLFGAIYRKL